MVYTNYHRGRRFEYRVKKIFEKHGWVVIRCARSKPFDLVALKNGKVILIECKKNGRIREDQRKMQEELSRKAGAKYLIISNNNIKDIEHLLQEG